MTKTAARKTANECCQGESKGMAVDNLAKNDISLLMCEFSLKKQAKI